MNNIDESLYKDENEKISTGKKIMSGIWKICLVAIVFVTLFLSLIQFGVITLTSSVIPDIVTVNQNEIGIKRGMGYQLVTTVLPLNASNKQVVYESTDPSVASVNEVTGYITAHKDGVATILVKTLINNKVTECKVNVGNKNISVSSLKIKDNKIGLASGSTKTLSYTISPSDATDILLNFTSSNPNVASVNSRGIITGIKEGTATITVSTNNNVVSDSVDVTVYKKGASTVVAGEVIKTLNYPKSISAPVEKNIALGSTLQLETKVTPDDAIADLKYMSTNPDVATVSDGGLIKAVSNGSAEILTESINGVTSVTKVSVGNYSIQLKKITITTRYSFMQIGQKKKLFVAYTPDNASNTSIVWSSSNPNVVSVDNEGNIIAKAVGSAKITATHADKDSNVKPDVINIEVGGNDNIVALDHINLDKEKRDIYVGSTDQITPTFIPQNATYKSVTYISDNPSIAKVDENGKVTGITVGSTVITVRANRSSASVKTTVNVKNNPSIGVELVATELGLHLNETYSLKATVKPSNASDKTVTYTSSSPSVATVDQFGLIRAVGTGTTKIIVKPNGGGAESTCYVTVN